MLALHRADYDHSETNLVLECEVTKRFSAVAEGLGFEPRIGLHL